MKNSRRKTMDRRDLLKGLATTAVGAGVANPLSYLVESIFRGQVNQALAQSAGVTPRRYLMIQLAGAPPKWCFNLPLTLNDGDSAKYISNPYVGTHWDGKTFSYMTSRVRGPDGNYWNMPYIWGFNVPSSKGGTRPMTDLLANMMILRGVDVGNPAHFGAQALQFRPTTTMPMSLGALVADNATSPIPAVNMGCQNFVFLSQKGNSSVPVAVTKTVLSNLLNPFIRTIASTSNTLDSFRSKESSLNGVLNDANQYLAKEAQSINGAYLNVDAATQNAKVLLKESFGGVDTTYANLLAKYTDLVTRSLYNSSTTINGFDSQSISGSTIDYTFGGANIGSNSGNILNTRSPGNLAAHFAIAEYILTTNLSSSVAISPGSINPYFDEHASGRLYSFVVSTYYQKCMAACLLELIDQLKAKNMFNDTIIQEAGEFGREPRAPSSSDSGSDHASNAYSTSFYGGAISGQVIGNLSRGSSGGTYMGTWGAGAPVAFKAGGTAVPLTIRHLCATIATLLRTPNPMNSSTPPVVAENSPGVITSTVEAPKLV